MFRKVTILLILITFVLNLSAQNKNNKVALKIILKSIEKKHNITFNFLENEILTIKIISPNPANSLDSKINYLQEKTGLFFENIDNIYFNIYTKDNIPSKKICGYVFSKINNLPLSNTNIRLENGASTTTNDLGYFEIETNKSNFVSITYVGYNSKIIPILNLLNKKCTSIFLDLQVAELADVKTNQYLTSGIIRKSDGTIQFKPKKQGLLPGLIEADVLQAMQQIPGINSADESVSSINVRGGTHDQNLFLWNGVKMYQTGHFFGLISVFNPDLAHTISISKNGSSAFYGESVSSVIDISSSTNEIGENKFGTGINMLNADIYSKTKINNKGYIEIATRKSTNDFFKTPTYNQYFSKAFQNSSITNLTNNENVNLKNDASFNFYDITFKYFQKIGDKNQLTIDFITVNDKLKVFQETNINSVLKTQDNNLYQKNIGGNVTFSRNWNAKNNSKINIFVSNYELDALQNKIQSNQNIHQENLVLDTGIKLENNHFITDKITFNNGYQYNEIGTTNIDAVNNPAFYRQITNVLRTHALIFEGKINDTISNIYLSTGLRMNYIENLKKMILEPRLQFHYDISKYLKTELLGEMKSQNSFQVIELQNDYFGIEKRRWVLANNTSIPIQQSKQVSINFSFSKNNWLLSIEEFYKKVNGIITAEQGFQNQLEFVKTDGYYSVIGTEILLQKKINHFLTWVSYSYNHNQYSFPELAYSSFSNNFELHHVLSFAAIYEKSKFKIALGSKWNSGRPKTSLASNTINYTNLYNPTIDYNTPNDKTLADFFQVNLSATYKWKMPKITYKLGISILNIY